MNDTGRRALGATLWLLGAFNLWLFVAAWRVVERAQASSNRATIEAGRARHVGSLGPRGAPVA